jgi:iron complex transport system ATP-binding protein
VLAARYRFDETRGAARTAARAALARTGMQAFESARLTELSGGERQRIAVAGLLAQGARLLLVDEPANHLDPARQAETYRLLGSLIDDGCGVLCVTHDVNLLVHVEKETRVLGLAEGRIRFDLGFGARELPERLAELFGVPMHVAEVAGKRLIVPLPSGGVRGAS